MTSLNIRLLTLVFVLGIGFESYADSLKRFYIGPGKWVDYQVYCNSGKDKCKIYMNPWGSNDEIGDNNSDMDSDDIVIAKEDLNNPKKWAEAIKSATKGWSQGSSWHRRAMEIADELEKPRAERDRRATAFLSQMAVMGGKIKYSARESKYRSTAQKRNNRNEKKVKALKEEIDELKDLAELEEIELGEPGPVAFQLQKAEERLAALESDPATKLAEKAADKAKESKDRFTQAEKDRMDSQTAENLAADKNINFNRSNITCCPSNDPKMKDVCDKAEHPVMTGSKLAQVHTSNLFTVDGITTTDHEIKADRFCSNAKPNQSLCMQAGTTCVYRQPAVRGKHSGFEFTYNSAQTVCLLDNCDGPEVATACARAEANFVEKSHGGKYRGNTIDFFRKASKDKSISGPARKAN